MCERGPGSTSNLFGIPGSLRWGKGDVDESVKLRRAGSVSDRSLTKEPDTNDIDPDELRPYGTVLTLEAEAGRLHRAHGVEDAVAALVKVLTGDAPRAAVLVGESGCGKTALVYELVHRLRIDPDGPWYVLRVAPAEFLAGTMYLGEWETKLKKLVEAVCHPRRVIHSRVFAGHQAVSVCRLHRSDFLSRGLHSRECELEIWLAQIHHFNPAISPLASHLRPRRLQQKLRCLLLVD